MRSRPESLPPIPDYQRPFSVVLLRCGGVACLWIFCFWIVASLCDLLPPLAGSVLAIVLVIGLAAIVQFALGEILNQVAKGAHYAQAGRGPTGKPPLPT